MRLLGVFFLSCVADAALATPALGHIAFANSSELSISAMPLAGLSHLSESSLHFMSFYETNSYNDLGLWAPVNTLLYIFSHNNNFESLAATVAPEGVGSGESFFCSLN